MAVQMHFYYGGRPAARGCRQLSNHAGAPSRSWDSVVQLHQVADDVVGGHPATQTLEKWFVGHHRRVSFPWISSSTVDKGGFKFGLTYTLDVIVRPSPVPIIKASPSPAQDFWLTRLFHWGTITHTLEKTLRGNKRQRAFVRFAKHNVATNMSSSHLRHFVTSLKLAKVRHFDGNF
ncbi:hypothetical protein B0H19DRAFT_1266813 [Mycena capillaripes]|nr:hypothetical protein B0H19DRAFT_1266813 [Mycena capillaripes]